MNRVSVLRESVETRRSSNPYLTSAQGGSLMTGWGFLRGSCSSFSKHDRVLSATKLPLVGH